MMSRHDVRAGIRDHVVQAVELKFNCFFLMPVVDAFPTRLREELEAAYEEDLDDVFDVAAVRAALEGRLRSLESELHQVRRVPSPICHHLFCYFRQLVLLLTLMVSVTSEFAVISFCSSAAPANCHWDGVGNEVLVSFAQLLAHFLSLAPNEMARWRGCSANLLQSTQRSHSRSRLHQSRRRRRPPRSFLWSGSCHPTSPRACCPTKRGAWKAQQAA